MTRAFLGLGSNLGDRRENLRRAVARLREQGAVGPVSSLYETDPVGFLDQPRFLNAVVGLETALPARDLLAFAMAIEAAVGRTPSFPQGPRLLDIDLLLYGDARVEEPDLVVPHPRLRERAFVLIPLAEIAPEVGEHVLGRTALDLAVRVAGAAGVRRTEGPEWAEPG
jgi:2-amino-4-hydroxy-6-hydroxymethyldihydropteridine diphosphokinase